MQIAPRTLYEWKLRTRSLAMGERTLVMGIVNVTPDSFSDGGQFVSTDAAVEHALQLLQDGADAIDVGGESTRPGAGAGTSEAISAEEEQSRVLPVIAALRTARPDAVISVDTYRAETARLAVDAGAEIVNDVSGMLWDRAMASTCADLRCGVVGMHTRGLPSEWYGQTQMSRGDLVTMVIRGLHDVALRLMLAGVNRSHVVLDPGFGFGKRGDENWTLLRVLSRLHELRFPLLAGLSRKGFLTNGEGRPEDRDEATAAANSVAALTGVHMVRVHNVARTRAALAVADAVRYAEV